MNRQEAYQILELDPSATVEDAKKQYRRLAMKYHPDRNKEAGAEAKFKEIKEAFELIESGKAGTSSNSSSNQYRGERRYWSGATAEDVADINDALKTAYEEMMRQYKEESDRFKKERPKPEGNNEEYQTNWGASGPGAKNHEYNKFQTLTHIVNVTLEEAFVGGMRQISVPDPASISGRMIQVKIPAGVSDGERVQKIETSNATVLVYVRVRSDYNVQYGTSDYQGGNIMKNIAVSALTMITGGFIEFKTIDGVVLNVRIPAGLGIGALLNLKEKGYWTDPRAVRRGNCMLRVFPVVKQLKDYTDKELSEMKTALDAVIAERAEKETPDAA